MSTPTRDLAAPRTDETPAATIAIAADGSVISWNAAAQTLFGYTEEEAIGLPIADLIVPPGSLDDEHARQRSALESGEAVYRAGRQRKDGSLLHTSVSLRALDNLAPGSERFVYSHTDISQL